jgi:cytochrome c-type biogenesis protein CcmH
MSTVNSAFSSALKFMSALRRRRIVVFCLALFGLLAASELARAVQPDEMLADPKLEARARALSGELRCMVCQNQSIDDSDAPLAHDIRVLIRELLSKGDSEEEVKTFLVSRYGDFVLLKPPLQANTLLLWGAPPLILIVGAAFLIAAIRRRGDANLSPSPLSAAEERRVSALLDDAPR